MAIGPHHQLADPPLASGDSSLWPLTKAGSVLELDPLLPTAGSCGCRTEYWPGADGLSANDGKAGQIPGTGTAWRDGRTGESDGHVSIPDRLRVGGGCESSGEESLSIAWPERFLRPRRRLGTS